MLDSDGYDSQICESCGIACRFGGICDACEHDISPPAGVTWAEFARRCTEAQMEANGPEPDWRLLQAWWNNNRG